jgi:hypothetical protein
MGSLAHWKDEKVARKEMAAIVRDLEHRGFAPEELSQIRDHRIVMLARDAALYRQLKAKPRGTVKPAPKRTLKPGTTTTETSQATRGLKQAREALKKTGSLDAGARVMERLGLLDDVK